MKRIYESRGINATLKTLTLFLLVSTSPVYAAAPVPVSWAQPHYMAAGEGFLVLGYRAGLEVWDWSLTAPLTRAVWQPGAEVEGLAVDGNDVFWVADSVLYASRFASEGLTPLWQIANVGTLQDLAVSGQFVAILVQAGARAEVQFWDRASPGTIRYWTAPGDAALATITLRDSTLAASGAGRVWLARLGTDTATTIDSTDFSVFASDAAWAGDTLLLAYGLSGLKLVPTAGDRYSGPAQSYSDGGFYNFLTVWDGGWASLGLFGQMLTFRRGTDLLPAASLQSEGTSRGLASQSGELAALTAEYGISTLNVFTPQTPYWMERMRLPGVVRSLDYSAIGMLANSDFMGVLRLGDSSYEWLMSNPYNVLDLDVDGNRVAATALLTGTAVFRLDDPPVQQPLSVVHTSVFTRQAEFSGNQMYVYTNSGCDSGFVICDVSNLADVRITDWWSVCVPIQDMERVSGGLAVAMGDSGIWMYQTPIVDSVAPVARAAAGHTIAQLAWRNGVLWSREDSGRLARWEWTGDTLRLIDEHSFANLVWFDAFTTQVATAGSDSTVRMWQWDFGGMPSEIEAWKTRTAPRLVAAVADTVWYVEKDIVYRATTAGGAGIEDDGGSVRPEDAILGQSYPNPFNGATTIPLNLRPGDWEVSIYNILGQRVKLWHGRALAPGPTQLHWDPSAGDGTSGASGVYLIRAQSGGIVESRKVIYLK